MTRGAVWQVLTVCWGLCVGVTAVQATPPTWWVLPAMETCEALGVPGVLAVAVILTESRGQPYAVRVNQGPGRTLLPATYEAAVQAVTVALQQQTTAGGDEHYPVVVDLGEQPPTLRPGMTVRVNFAE